MDIELSDAVLAAQIFGTLDDDPAVGTVRVFRLGDPAANCFDVTLCAVYTDWKLRPGEQLRELLKMKRLLIHGYRLERSVIESALNVIPEYRHWRRSVGQHCLS